MRFDAVIELVSPGGYTVDEIGQQVPDEPTARTVYANKFAVGTREFYDAGAAGLKPEREYQVRSIEYGGETLLRADGLEFNIIRVKDGGEFTRLVCERVLANG